MIVALLILIVLVMGAICFYVREIYRIAEMARKRFTLHKYIE